MTQEKLDEAVKLKEMMDIQRHSVAYFSEWLYKLESGTCDITPARVLYDFLHNMDSEMQMLFLSKMLDQMRVRLSELEQTFNAL